MPGTFPGMNGQSLPMRLVIVDDHQMVLDGLKAMLRPYADPGGGGRRGQRPP